MSTFGRCQHLWTISTFAHGAGPVRGAEAAAPQAPLPPNRAPPPPSGNTLMSFFLHFAFCLLFALEDMHENDNTTDQNYYTVGSFV